MKSNLFCFSPEEKLETKRKIKSMLFIPGIGYVEGN
jgi:hypothetical protein